MFECHSRQELRTKVNYLTFPSLAFLLLWYISHRVGKGLEVIMYVTAKIEATIMISNFIWALSVAQKPSVSFLASLFHSLWQSYIFTCPWLLTVRWLWVLCVSRAHYSTLLVSPTSVNGLSIHSVGQSVDLEFVLIYSSSLPSTLSNH